MPPSDQTATPTATKQNVKSKDRADSDLLPVLGQTSKAAEESEEPENVGVSSLPPIPAMPTTPAPKGRKDKQPAEAHDSDSDDDSGILPTPFTPSINKTLNMASKAAQQVPLPAGLTVSELKKRLDTKKKIK